MTEETPMESREKYYKRRWTELKGRTNSDIHVVGVHFDDEFDAFILWAVDEQQARDKAGGLVAPHKPVEIQYLGTAEELADEAKTLLESSYDRISNAQ